MTQNPWKNDWEKAQLRRKESEKIPVNQEVKTNKEMEKITNALKEEKSAHTQTKEEIKNLKKALEEEKSAHTQTEEEIKNLKKALEEEKSAHTQTEEEIKNLKKALEEGESAHTQTKEEIKNLKKALEEEKSAYTQTKEELEKLRKSLEKFEPVQTKEEIEQLKKALEEEKFSHTQTKEEFQEKEIIFETIKGSLQILEESNNSLKQQLEEEKKKRQKSKKKIQSLKEQLQQQQQQIHQLQQQLDQQKNLISSEPTEIFSPQPMPILSPTPTQAVTQPKIFLVPSNEKVNLTPSRTPSPPGTPSPTSSLLNGILQNQESSPFDNHFLPENGTLNIISEKSSTPSSSTVTRTHSRSQSWGFNSGKQEAEKEKQREKTKIEIPSSKLDKVTSNVETITQEKKEFILSPLRKTLTGLEPVIKEDPKKIENRRTSAPVSDNLMVRAKCGETTFSVSCSSNGLVKEAISKLKKRLPDDPTYREYCLFIKKKGNPIILDENKPLSEYKQYLIDPKITLDFDKLQSKRKPKKSKDQKTLEEVTKQKDILAIEQLLYDSTAEDLHIVDEENQSPIFWAINSDSLKIVNLFIESYRKLNLDINSRDRHGWTILHLALSKCTESAHESIVDIIKILLHYPGLDVLVANSDGNTPLHFYAHYFSLASWEEIGNNLIIKAPTSINSKNNFGETPLHQVMLCNSSIRNQKGKFLIQHGADVNAVNNSSITPLHYAVRLNRKDLIKILLNFGANVTKDICATALELKSTEIVELLKSAKGLKKFLVSNGLEEYFPIFLTQELDLEVLAKSDEKTLESLMNQLNIQSIGTRVKFKKACIELKEKTASKELQSKMMKVEITSGNSEVTAKLKESMEKIMESSPPWLINNSELTYTKEIGTGGNGKVYKGLYRGAKVAIKVLKDLNSYSLRDFKQECQVMSSLNSPFVVKFFGACIDPRAAIVLEFCVNGSLLDLLKNPKFFIDWKMGYRFASDIANGLNYLHSQSPPVFHRDVKTANFLVDKDHRLKICDMGLARYNTDKNSSTLGRVAGTYCYMAPEVTSEGNKYTEKCDIFSMGIVFWEIVFRICEKKYEPPYYEYSMPLEFQIAIEVEKGLRPTVPSSADQLFSQIILRCLKKNPHERPTTTELLDVLSGSQPVDVHF